VIAACKAEGRVYYQFPKYGTRRVKMRLPEGETRTFQKKQVTWVYVDIPDEKELTQIRELWLRNKMGEKPFHLALELHRRSERTANGKLWVPFRIRGPRSANGSPRINATRVERVIKWFQKQVDARPELAGPVCADEVLKSLLAARPTGIRSSSDSSESATG
jgi:hypothetical protein